MDLGQRIREARLAAGLSQRQLCGDTITRNMLSQIENGSARPSMDTLRYLAARLEKSVSYFLEEAAPSPNQSRMAAARAAYAAGAFSAALDCLREYQTPDDVFDAEALLLRSLSLIALAEQETDPAKARQLLAQAAEAGNCSPYYTRELERRRLLCLARVAPETCVFIADTLKADDRELLLRARASLETGDAARCAAYLEAAADHNAPQWLLLRGDAAMQAQELPLAKQCYHLAEAAAPELACPKLEQYYLKQEDFKMAYHYACKQR